MAAALTVEHATRGSFPAAATLSFQRAPQCCDHSHSSPAREGGCRQTAAQTLGDLWGARPAAAHGGTHGSPTHGTDPCIITGAPERLRNNPFRPTPSREEVLLLCQILSPWKGSNSSFKFVTKHNQFVTKEEKVPKNPGNFWQQYLKIN